MKTLESKEIVGYLPYGIPAKLSKKGIFNQDDEYPNPRTLELGLIKNISFWGSEITGQLHISDTYSFDFDEIDEVDICLLPLSMLNKEIDYGPELGGKRILMEDHIFFMELTTEGKELSTLSDLFIYYGNITNLLDIKKIIDELYRFHIDIHGLIEKGFAIDKTTLK